MLVTHEDWSSGMALFRLATANQCAFSRTAKLQVAAM
jgi:hypothetical protein